ncbi:MAG: hypothetical protein U5J98_00730 [Halobacteriales archaeon]|nr:hypothetical protein [Halobacteriales archaeon]
MSSVVERMPILTTVPLSPLSSTTKSPSLYVSSKKSAIPPKKFATVSFAAKPMAMPAMPAAPSRGVISMPQMDSNSPRAATAIESVQTFENTGAASKCRSEDWMTSIPRSTTRWSDQAQRTTMTESAGRARRVSSVAWSSSVSDATGVWLNSQRPPSAIETTTGQRRLWRTTSSSRVSLRRTSSRRPRMSPNSTRNATSREPPTMRTVASSSDRPSSSVAIQWYMPTGSCQMP